MAAEKTPAKTRRKWVGIKVKHNFGASTNMKSFTLLQKHEGHQKLQRRRFGSPQQKNQTVEAMLTRPKLEMVTY